jgi:putative Holliday junction resolvase
MSILALDIGKKKIGIAISRSGLIAYEYCTLFYDDKDRAVMELILIAKKENIKILVIGMPHNPDGNDKQQIFTEDFSKKLKDKIAQFDLKIKIVFENEYLTSKEAESKLFELGLSPEIIRQRRDQMSAKIILDQYLDKS